MTLRVVPTGEVLDLWPAVDSQVAEALGDEAPYAPRDILMMVLTEQATLWVWEKDGRPAASMVTMIRRYPLKTVLLIYALGGADMIGWMDEFPKFVAWARERGVTHIDLLARRRGWLRVLRHWTNLGSVLEYRV